MAATTKNPKNDPTRFEGPGINFRAKLIGVDDVEEARGDKICQLAMQKLKAAVKAAGEHKQKIVVNVSLEGLKIIDGVSLAVQYTHAVHRISFIARDMSDNRAFGYIFGVGDGTHKFYAIKTEKAAENLVLTLRDLFEVVYEIKKKEIEEAKKKQEEEVTENGEVEGENKEGQKSEEESVYQAPPNRDSPEHIYAVPRNNSLVKPEETSESNLLDLKDQLDNLGLGIEQMSSFDTLMSGANASQQPGGVDPWGTPTTTSSSGSGLSDLQGLQGGFAPPSPFQQPGFGPTQPFGAPTSTVPGMAAPGMVAPGMTVPGGNPFGPQTKTFPPQPTTGLPITPDPFANDPFSTSQVRMPFPGSPAGYVAATGAFPQPGAPFTPPGARPAFGQPAAGFSPPAAGFVQSTPGFGQPAAAFPAVPGASPFGGAAAQPAAPQQNFAGFPEDVPIILAPEVLGKEETVEEPPQPEKKDAFSDLVDIGGLKDSKKTPKDMFAELNTPPKKSMNELKMETMPGLTPGTTSPARSPSPATAMGVPQASDPFGPLSKEMDKVQDLAATTADPFDTSHVHITPSLQMAATSLSSDLPPITESQSLQSKLPNALQTVKPDAAGDANHNKILSEKCVLKIPNGKLCTFLDEFQLPSPEEPPPPLPNTVKLSFSKSAPPPPPRPKVDSTSPSVRPRPGPRKITNGSASSPALSALLDSDKSVFPTCSSDPFLSPPYEVNSVHNDKDPFLPAASNNNCAFSSSTSDPFLAPLAKVTNSVHNGSDPFLCNKVTHFECDEDKWKAFGDFDSDPFTSESSAFTANVPKKVTHENQASPFGDPFAAPGQDPLYAQVQKKVPQDNSLI